jgi:hypothetical protein
LLIRGAAASALRGQATKRALLGAGSVASGYIVSGLVETGVGAGLAVPEVIGESNLNAIGAEGGQTGSVSLTDFIPGSGTVSSYKEYLRCERGY